MSDDEQREEGATVLPYIGPDGLDGDALRRIADDMEAGEIDDMTGEH